jgi:hypothetical protein
MRGIYSTDPGDRVIADDALVRADPDDEDEEDEEERRKEDEEEGDGGDDGNGYSE